MPTTLETCANCTRTIGKLEKACIWDEQVVCAQCLARLNQSPAAAASTVQGDAIDRELAALDRLPTAPAPSARIPEAVQSSAWLSRNGLPAGSMICSNPHCGHIGAPDRKSRGSAVVMILLLLFFLLPGILYVIFMSGYDYYCTRCGMKLRTEHR